RQKLIGISRDLVAYQTPSIKRSVWQMANSILPFAFFWYLSYASLATSYALTLLFGFAAALFAVRIFVIFHDCGHGSFFKSRRANDIVGFITGVISFTPYQAWRHAHALHHATSGDLDRRGFGDVWTLTRDEYATLPRWKQHL